MERRYRFTDGRLEKGPALTFQQAVTTPTLEHQVPRFYSYLQVDLAHTVMLTEQGIIPREDGAAILRALRELRDLGPDTFAVDPELNSYLFQVEDFLASRVGVEVGGKMHTARGRADYGAACLTLWTRDHLVDVLGAVLNFQETLVEVADRYRDTLMPGYTHLQQSQPMTLGHYFLSHFYPFQRDFERLQGAFKRGNMSSLGSCARAGTSWPIDQHRTAELLGHDALVMNAQDQTYYRRDHMAEVAAVLSLVMSNLGRLVTDLDVWYSREFGYIDIDDAYAGSSSIMPHKKNPYPFERTRAIAGEAIGWMPTILGVLKLPHTSAADPTFSGEHEGGLVGRAGAQITQLLRLMGEVLETMTVNEELMEARAIDSWMGTSHLSDTIVRSTGLPFRAAHRIVARLVRMCTLDNVRPTEVTGELLDRAAQEMAGQTVGLSTDQVRRALHPREFIETRVTIGSSNPTILGDALEAARTTLDEEKEWYREVTGRLNEAEHKLEAAVDVIIAEVVQE